MGAGRAADRRLGPFVVLVVAIGFGCLGWAILHAGKPSSLLYVVIVTALVAVATICAPRLRIGGEPHQVTSASATILIALAVLPSSWALICVAAGVVIAQVARRMHDAQKIAFNASAQVISATAAVAVLRLCDLAPDLTVRRGLPGAGQIGALIVAAVVYAIADELITPTVIALASGLTWRAVISRDADIRTAVRVANVLTAGSVIALLDHRLDLVLAMPFAIATLYLVVLQRLRQRATDRTVAHLALATADLASTDLTTVLHRAAHAAVRLLSAAEAEVEAHIGAETRLVRVHNDAIVYDGPALDAPPPVDAPTLVLGEDSDRTTALLRLRFKSPTALSNNEHEALRAFSLALNDALSSANGASRSVRQPADDPATRDALTGLGNRRYLEERAAHMILAPGQFAVALVDLNRLKHVNDTLGHAAGDQLLITIARRLAGAVTGSDTVARLGGDEFAVVFADLETPAEGVRRIEAVLNATLTEAVEVHGIAITVAAAAGIAVGPALGGLPELLRRADVAMYQAKWQGDRVRAYEPELDAARQLTTGQVVVTFEPVVDLATGRLTAAHALTNWRHQDRRRINPRRLALEHPTVVPAFNRHVLDLALAASASWRAAEHDLPVVVHIAGRSLLEPNFAADLGERLARAHVPADRLTIELGENLLHANFDAVNTTIRALATMGVRLGLTEFGVGASSLATLTHIPIHQLTIAPELVAQVDRSAGAAVIRSILDLGRHLGLTIVADGVATENQRIALRDLGCAVGQGALFDEAMSAERLLETVRIGPGGLRPAMSRGAHDA